MDFLIALFALPLAYCLGSLSSAILVCRLFSLPDPRVAGSKNPGATNVLRLGGRLPAFLTLLGDILKGFLPVLLVKLVTSNPYIISAVLLAAILGHLYPVFFQFKGGKGVATAIGALLALSPVLGILFVCIWLIVFALTRYSSLSAMLATVCMPLCAWFVDKRYIPVLLLLAIIILWRHRENIARLVKGQEDKVGSKN
jgi:glycerol-3-phosphate acyltransferase PlsY